MFLSKPALLALLAGSLALPATGQSIQILNPQPGETVAPGAVYRIEWQATGIEGPVWQFFLNEGPSMTFLMQLFPTPIDDGNGAWHADWSVDAGLAPSSLYDLVVKDDTAQADDHSGFFTIGNVSQPCSKPWDYAPVAPTSAYGQVRAVDLVVLPDGSEHILYYWDDTTGGRGEMRYIMRAAGAAWNPAIAEIIGGNASHHTSLAIDGAGNAFCGLSIDPWECVYTSGIGPLWQQFACSPSGDFGKGGQGCVVEVNGAGWPRAAYFYGPAEDAYFAEWTGSAWTIESIETAGRVGKGIHLDLTPDGRPVVAYMNQDTASTHFAERAASGAWSIVPFAQSDPMDVLVTVNGDAYLLTRSATQGPPLSLWHRSGSEANWSPVSGFPGAGYKFGRLAGDSVGNIAVAALTAGDAVDVISQTTAGWETCAITSGDSDNPAIAFTPFNTLVVAYKSDDSLIWTATESVGTWEDLGMGLAGTHGVPELSGSGALTPVTTVQVNLDNAREWSPAHLVVGLSTLLAPFKGGVLLPNPDLIVSLVTDGIGEVNLSATWPPGVPGDTSFFLQYWIEDLVGPKGYSASNGLKGTTP